MAGQNGKRHTTHQTLAITFVLGCLFSTFTCFNLERASNSVEHKAVGAAAALEVGTARIIVNGEDLKSQSVSAAQNREPTNVESYHLNGTGVSEWTLELEDPTASEATLKQMNASLHCGENTMTLNATGPRAADLELDMGDGQPMLLTEMPETCGHSVQQNAQSLILVVSTMGCNVIEENGNYVLSIRWRGTPVNLTCPVHPTPLAPSEKAGKPDYPHKPWNMYLRKQRHVKHLDPYGFGKPVTQPPAATVSTTARPHQMPPFAHPYSPYYYYYYYYYPYYSYHPYYHHYFQYPIGGPLSPTTSNPMKPQKSPNLCNPSLPAKHPFPLMSYYEFMRRCYGKRPNVVPTNPVQTTVLPYYTLGPTRTPTVTIRRTNITTRPTAVKTTKRCKFFRPAGNYRIVEAYEPYQEKPFDLFFSEKLNHADNAEKGKYMPRTAYGPTGYFQTQPYPGFEDLTPVPGFPEEP